MKTISIRLEDSIYEELGDMLDEMGQTKQTFYETFTRTALRERSNNRRKIEAFERLEAIRRENKKEIDFNKEREEAMNEKYGIVD